MLFIFGESDRQIPVDESANAIRTALTDAGRQDFTIETFADADHMLLIDYQPAPGYLEAVTEWLMVQTRR